MNAPLSHQREAAAVEGGQRRAVADRHDRGSLEPLVEQAVERGFRRFVGLKGVSDILGILPQTVRVEGDPRPVTFGNLLAVETKRPGEKLRPDQVEFLRRVNEQGGVGLCVQSVRELEEKLKAYLGPVRRSPDELTLP